MGISEFLTVFIMGAGASELVREAWRRMRASADEIKPVVETKPEPPEGFRPVYHLANRQLSESLKRGPVNRVARWM